MKKLIILSSFILVYFPVLGQQFTFKQLLSMTSSRSMFESSMIKIGNSPKSVSSFSNYEYKLRNDSVVFIEVEDRFQIDSNMTDISKTTYEYSEFVENYDKDDEKGSTFYVFSSRKFSNLKGKIPGSNEKNRISLEIEYIRSSDYLNVLKQITSISRYVETKDISFKSENPKYVSVYKIDSSIVEVCKSDDRSRGGTIKIIIP